jgi:hypothetical protein
VAWFSFVPAPVLRSGRTDPSDACARVCGLRRNSYETTKQLVVLALGVLAHLHRVGLNRRPYLIKKKQQLLRCCLCVFAGRAAQSLFLLFMLCVMNQCQRQLVCVRRVSAALICDCEPYQVNVIYEVCAV